MFMLTKLQEVRIFTLHNVGQSHQVAAAGSLLSKSSAKYQDPGL